MGNSFGKIFKLTSFGESHGDSIGGIVDGCPAGLKLDLEQIQLELNRRKPGQSEITTSRTEDDQVIFHSGLLDNVTLGTPLAFSIKNKDHRSKDYSTIKEVFRPSHADFAYQEKYGVRDYRGGGRSSARETIARVVAGAIAKQILGAKNISIFSYVESIGNVAIDKSDDQLDLTQIDSSTVRCPDDETSKKMHQHILAVKEDGDSLGGVIQGRIIGLPPGVGEPVFDKLNARLAYAMMGINAVKGFEIGSGFKGTTMKGSEHNDSYVYEENQIKTTTNFSGGIQGGISNGMPITFRVAFKPTATISKSQSTIDVEGNEINLSVEGRHDPCVVPRAVPIVDAMAAMVVVDLWLQNKVSKLENI